jgi:predicted dehydrogenase
MTTSPVRRDGLTRRRFLGYTAAAAGPLILPGRAFGATAPSNRLTLGFIGMGKMARGHLDSFRRDPACQVLAICDVESRRLKQTVEQTNAYYARAADASAYTGCAGYHDFRELVARDDIDAVVICTPNHWHALTALAALQAGKDVYLEKPLTLTIEESVALMRAVARYDRVFQTGSQQRSDPTFRYACELVRNGRIGRIHTVHVNVGGPPVECYLPPEPVPEGLDWDFWLGPAPERPYHSDIAPPMDFEGWPNWRSYRDYAGGGMDDFGAHHYDIAQWGLGMDHTGPVEVHPPSAEYPRITYKYANGITMYHGGGKPGSAVEFIGDAGRVRVNRGQYLETEPEEVRGMAPGPNEIHLYESTNHKDNWLECIRTRSKPICDVEIGAHTANICHIGNICYWLNRPLAWNPEAYRFENDEEANRLLGRPMRGPWRLTV